jgi:hypothetical protein
MSNAILAHTPAPTDEQIDRILEYTEMELFFVAGDSDAP